MIGSGPLRILAVALLFAACGPASSDPAFVSTELIATEPCSTDELCVTVRAPVDGNRTGVGRCSVFAVGGDPAFEIPLAESGDLEMTPGEAVNWQTAITTNLDLGQLNPVCSPMAEG